MTENESIGAITLPVAWVSLDDMPVLAANQFIAQVYSLSSDTPEEITFTIGHATPPYLTGTLEQQQAMAATQSFIPVRPILRLALSKRRAQELIEVLGNAIQQLEQGQSRHAEGGES